MTDLLAAAIAAHAEQGLPDEVCGYLMGREFSLGRRWVRRIVPVSNSAGIGRTASRYRICAESFLHAERLARRNGLSLFGCYHSHPGGPAQPSRQDLDDAVWPGFSYLIVSAGSGLREMKSFALTSDRNALREDVVVVLPESESTEVP